MAPSKTMASNGRYSVTATPSPLTARNQHQFSAKGCDQRHSSVVILGPDTLGCGDFVDHIAARSPQGARRVQVGMRAERLEETAPPGLVNSVELSVASCACRRSLALPAATLDSWDNFDADPMERPEWVADAIDNLSR